MNVCLGLVSAIVVLMLAGSLPAAAATGDAARLDVYPPDIQLDNARHRQRFIVVATRADGVTQDVTAQAKAVLADAKFAKLEGTTLAPLADGQTRLEVEFAGQKVSVPVTVRSASASPPPSFKLDVMPTSCDRVATAAPVTAPPGARTASASRCSVSIPTATTTG